MVVYGRVYRSLSNTLLETASLLNLAALSIVNCISTNTNSTVLLTTSTIVSVAIALALFVAITLIHIKMLLKKNKRIQTLFYKRKHCQAPQLGRLLLEDVASIGNNTNLPTTRPMKAREEMIFEIFIDGENDNDVDDDDENILQ